MTPITYNLTTSLAAACIVAGVAGLAGMWWALIAAGASMLALTFAAIAAWKR